MQTLPEIRIIFSHLLYFGESHQISTLLRGGNAEIQEVHYYEQKTVEYRVAWAKYEKPLLEGIVKALGVSFYKPVIDVALAPFFRSKSNPLIINFHSEADRFVDVLTHELLHVLQTDNDKYQSAAPEPHLNLISEWQSLFGSHSHHTLIHIPLHALHKYLYLDVLNAPERLQRDIGAVQNNPAYVQAWDYVAKHDYHEIVGQLRALYEKA